MNPESTGDLKAQFRALGPDAAETLARAPRPPDELLLRLRFAAQLVAEMGPIQDDAVLILRQAAGNLEVKPVNEKLIFGRIAGCDLKAPSDIELSRSHFQLIRENQNYFVEDLSSRNGTYVNNYETRIARRQLRNGDLILAGAQVLLFLRREADFD